MVNLFFECLSLFTENLLVIDCDLIVAVEEVEMTTLLDLVDLDLQAQMVQCPTGLAVQARHRAVGAVHIRTEIL